MSKCQRVSDSDSLPCLDSWLSVGSECTSRLCQMFTPSIGVRSPLYLPLIAWRGWKCAGIGFAMLKLIPHRRSRLSTGWQTQGCREIRLTTTQCSLNICLRCQRVILVRILTKYIIIQEQTMGDIDGEPMARVGVVG